MSKVEASAVERIIANTINETARGDPDALAARIVAALAEAISFRPTGERTPHHAPRGQSRDSSIGAQTEHSWFLVRDPATGSAFVRHQANAPSGGQVTDIDLGAFLSGPGSRHAMAVEGHGSSSPLRETMLGNGI